MTPAECRAIAARAIASGAIKVVPARPVDVRAVVKHADPSAKRVLARYGKVVRAVAKEHGLDVAAVAGRSAEYKAMEARRACWRRLVASGSSVSRLAEAWGVAYKTVAVGVNAGGGK